MTVELTKSKSNNVRQINKSPEIQRKAERENGIDEPESNGRRISKERKKRMND